MKLTKRLICLVLTLTIIISTSSIVMAKSKDNDIEDSQINSNIIDKLDNYIKLDKNNKFVVNDQITIKKIVSQNLNEANSLLNASNIKLNENDILKIIQVRIKLINDLIDQEKVKVNFNKEIITDTKISPYAYGYSDWEHELRNYWWGSKHIYRSNRAAESHASSITKLSVGTGLGILVPGFAVPAGITTAYLQLMANSIRTAKSLYNKSYMDVTLAFVYNTGEWLGN